jgi:CubicO group peptidase (beta-lactamase class C family)
MTDALAPLHDVMAAEVGAGRLPGLVALVARGDEVHVEVAGTPAFDDGAPLRRDAIFRIASLTKPLVAAAALSLVDSGELGIDQPIDDLVPELASPRVLRSIDSPLSDTVPALRSITVADLLTSRMGFGSVMEGPGDLPIQRAEADAYLQSIGGPPWPPGPYDVDGWIAALGSLPLMHQPGSTWLYGTSLQVLGVVVARAASADLGTVLQDRVLSPLGMDDTGFWVPADRLDRLTTLYMPDAAAGGSLTVLDAPGSSWWATPPRLPDAGGWLVSTIDDFWAFVSMLLAGGLAADGTRVLSAAAVSAMTTDQLTPSQRDSVFGGYGSWGYGMLVPAAGATDVQLPSGIGWDGGTGVTWRTDPGRGVTGILFTQIHALSPAPTPLNDTFWSTLRAL